MPYQRSHNGKNYNLPYPIVGLKQRIIEISYIKSRLVILPRNQTNQTKKQTNQRNRHLCHAHRIYLPEHFYLI